MIKRVKSETFKKDGNDSESNFNCWFLGSVDSWKVLVKVNNCQKSDLALVQIDTDSEANIITKDIIEKLGGEIQLSTTRLVSYDK